jgi:hypothetical protein
VQLSLREGWSLYHLGDCEHTITVNEVRTITSADVQDAAKYPLQTAMDVPAAEQCDVCAKSRACYIVLNDDRAGHDRSPRLRLALHVLFRESLHRSRVLFCDSCHRSFHYDSSGVLLPVYQRGRMRVFPYVPPMFTPTDDAPSTR